MVSAVALALYRKYRPATFAEVVGQEHVTEPLRTALRSGRVNHAYLFSGPRGCGKTSSARILARSLNCVAGPTDEPCGECDSCVNLAPNGPGSVDVVELDAASHGGVDDARELRDKAFYAPAESRYRVFVIDEAHMVTPQGFNALLKIVEEPPEHLVFVFATTEPDKVLTTIRSRTHHYPFRLIPPGAMRELLERNCAAEGIAVEPAVLPLVVRAGGGSARDTQSVLDQLLAGAGSQGIRYEQAMAMLGVTDLGMLDDMIDAFAAEDGATVFATVDRLVEAGHDPRRFASDLLDRLRDLLLLRAVPDATERGLVAAPPDELESMQAQAERLGPAALTRYAEIVHDGLAQMRGATAPRLLLELLCGRMLLPGAAEDAAALLHRVERLERRLTASGGAQAAPAVEAGAGTGNRATPKPSEPDPAVAGPSGDGPPGPPGAHPPAEQPSVQRPASEPPPAAGTQETAGMDAAAVRRVWSEILAAVRGSSRSVEAMLSAAGVQSVEGSEIVLSHTAEPLVRRLSEARNVDTVAGALQQVLGGEWRVRWVPVGSAPQPSGAQPAPAQQRPKPQSPAAADTRAEPHEPEPEPASGDALPPEHAQAEEPEPEAPAPAERVRAPEPPASDERDGTYAGSGDDAATLLQEQLGARRIER